MIKQVLGVFFFLCTLPTSAQFESSIAFQFNQYVPETGFKNNVTRNPIGGLLSFAMNKEESAWQFGLELGVGLYSGKKYFYETVEEGVPDNFVRLYEENGFISYHLLARHFLLLNRIIDVYLEGKMGASTYFSAIRSMRVSDVFEDRFLFHDTTVNIGGGAGVQINIGKLMGKIHWKRKLYLDLSAIYLIGGNVTYRNSVKNELVDTFSAGYRNSDSDMLQIRSGIVLKF